MISLACLFILAPYRPSTSALPIPQGRDKNGELDGSLNAVGKEEGLRKGKIPIVIDVPPVVLVPVRFCHQKFAAL